MNIIEDPYDPMCERYASQMDYLDTFWAESQEELDSTNPEDYQGKRIEYIKKEEGTYNRLNGHFLCDSCYIKAGMPLGTCP